MKLVVLLLLVTLVISHPGHDEHDHDYPEPHDHDHPEHPEHHEDHDHDHPEPKQNPEPHDHSHSFSDNADVILLDDSSFKATTQVGEPKMQYQWFIMFFAPWCGHCKRLIPTWEQLATKYKASTTVKIAAIDCEANSDTRNQFGISGFPTLIFFDNTGKQYSFRERRDLETLSKFIEGGYLQAKEYVKEDDDGSIWQQLGIWPIVCISCLFAALVVVCICLCKEEKLLKQQQENLKKQQGPLKQPQQTTSQQQQPQAQLKEDQSSKPENVSDPNKKQKTE
eukprot:TRINITY_DN608_c0_g1_i4.p2 TRINITY_DN608_c0_g1~~TRINITY_DN608_c0_g1_i4.p2  ORF type:complete len:280 (-),score=46.98 TRINITY_DN608_c0_g1_i4:378-1217(-)